MQGVFAPSNFSKLGTPEEGSKWGWCHFGYNFTVFHARAIALDTSRVHLVLIMIVLMVVDDPASPSTSMGTIVQTGIKLNQ